MRTLNPARHLVRFACIAARIEAAAIAHAEQTGTLRGLDVRDMVLHNVALAQRQIAKGHDALADDDWWEAAEHIACARTALHIARKHLTGKAPRFAI